MRSHLSTLELMMTYILINLLIFLYPANIILLVQDVNFMQLYHSYLLYLLQRNTSAFVAEYILTPCL
jgi:hypothetical protein